MGLDPHQFRVLLFLMLISPALVVAAAKLQPEKGCSRKCGEVEIPYPFGMSEGCYLNKKFSITCNTTSYNPPQPFLRSSTINVTGISLEGQLHILKLIGKRCYNRSGGLDNVAEPVFALSNFNIDDTANKLVVVGCDSYAWFHGRSGAKRFNIGCMSMCGSRDEVNNGTCNGGGCCETIIPEDIVRANLTVGSFYNHTSVWDFNPCSFAFVVEKDKFNFTLESLTNLEKVDKLPLVLDWTIGNETCEIAQKNQSNYACQDNTVCNDVGGDNSGYRCTCKDGYEGNPYLLHGCQDRDECKDPSLNNCEKLCVNTLGGFYCVCPKGYNGDGIKDGRGCVRGESLIFKFVAGVALGIIVLLLAFCWLHLELKRRRTVKMRQNFFLQNGGILLQERLARRGTSSDHETKIFSASELHKATNGFHQSMIVGQGGYGTVYKGLLSDNRIVAIKKSKEVDPNQIEQFINEVVVLSQINHRNVVKLLGCCLETQVPLLVYEFVSNGTLFEHIHDKAKASFLSWDMRLRIATETAGVLSYLHSAASTPIIHRDMKSANILLDHTFTAKVSDFGSSRLVPCDQTQLSTMVQGTFGYLDPEYMQTNQLNEKSDVYSFGVVLVELLTGRKALSYDRPEEERNLVSFFLSAMKQEGLFQILEDNVVREGKREQLMKVAVIAKNCLNIKRDDRPFMKEVAMELEGLRVVGKHSGIHTAEDMESMQLVERFNGFTNIYIGEGNSTSVAFDSVGDHIILPVAGGR